MTARSVHSIAFCLLLAACSSQGPTAAQECEDRGGVYHSEREECFGDVAGTIEPESNAEESREPTPTPTPRPTPEPTAVPTLRATLPPTPEPRGDQDAFLAAYCSIIDSDEWDGFPQALERFWDSRAGSDEELAAANELLTSARYFYETIDAAPQWADGNPLRAAFMQFALGVTVDMTEWIETGSYRGLDQQEWLENLEAAMDIWLDTPGFC